MEFKNTALLTGQVLGEVKITHEAFGESFCEGFIKVERNSGVFDVLPFVMSEWFLKDPKEIEEMAGKYVTIHGEIRSRNVLKAESAETSKKSYRSAVYVFVRKFEYRDVPAYENEVTVSGYIKADEIISRETPKSGRVVSDVFLAVPRFENFVKSGIKEGIDRTDGKQKNDNVPCIVWGRNALYAERFKKGDSVEIKGRFQSRAYEKVVRDETFDMITYEVSGIQITPLQ